MMVNTMCSYEAYDAKVYLVLLLFWRKKNQVRINLPPIPYDRIPNDENQFDCGIRFEDSSGTILVPEVVGTSLVPNLMMKVRNS